MCRSNYHVHFLSAHRPAALCLAQALLKCPVPKSLMWSASWDCVGVTEGYASSNLKETLVAWLLMSDQSEEVEDSSRPHPIICRLALLFLSLIFFYIYVCKCLLLCAETFHWT